MNENPSTPDESEELLSNDVPKPHDYAAEDETEDITAVDTTAVYEHEEAPKEKKPSSRRNVLTGIGVLAAGLTIAPALFGEKAIPSAAAAITDKLRAGNVSFEWHLARRCSFVPTEKLVKTITASTWKTWLQNQIYKPTTFSDAALETFLKEHYKIGFYNHHEQNLPDMIDKFRFSHTAAECTLLRRVYTNRHVMERMTEFWMDLLSVHVDANGTSATNGTYTNLIRNNSLGKFSDLLYEATNSYSMNAMLTNFNNREGAINENFGREILELHTVGVTGGYTEDDVKNSARVLSGWTAANYTMTFNEKRHSYGAVQVMGWKHANTNLTSQSALVRSYVDYLAMHDKTAQRLCERLVRKFVREDLTSTDAKNLIKALKATYLANKTDIKPVLWQLFTSKEFANSVGMKFARPNEWIPKTHALFYIGWDKKAQETINPLSNSETVASYTDTLTYQHQQLRCKPMGWISPDGYPEDALFWSGSSSMFQGHKVAFYGTRAYDKLSLPVTDWAKTLGVNNAMTVDAIVDRGYRYTHGFTPAGEIRTTLKNLVGSYGLGNDGRLHPITVSHRALNSMMGVIAASPHLYVR